MNLADLEVRVPQGSVAPQSDLREMLRRHIITSSLECMERAEVRRTRASESADWVPGYRDAIRSALQGFYGSLPVGDNAPAPEVTAVSCVEYEGFRIENVLFDSFPGWQVNASVYVPTNYEPPFPVVIMAVGHSGKQFESYQLPCQYFARSGYLVVCFDPPGQASEKQPGNDHFNDGVRLYPLGQTSSRYFIGDALRCIDYAETRADVDISRGVAMTGVSGGGTTTTFAAVLDDRIAVTGPSCCVTPLADLDISWCYAGCPETHQFGRYAAGLDEIDLLCVAAPRPCLLMAGEGDKLFRIDNVRQLAGVVQKFYDRAGAGENFRFFADSAGHAYTLAQAREFTGFMNRWLLDKPDRPVCGLPDEAFAMRPYDELRCWPDTNVNMRSIAVADAAELVAGRDTSPAAVRRGAVDIAGGVGEIAVPESEVAEGFPVWRHDWYSVMLRPEPGIELPATFLGAEDELPMSAVLHIDDAGRHRLLHSHGLLCQAMRFLAQEGDVFSLLTVDVRGWGDTTPAVYPYEMVSWGSVDRYLAYGTAALGDPVMSMRIRDALAALAWLRTRPEVDPKRIVVTGCGMGAMVALHVGAIAPSLAGVVAWEGLSSVESLIGAEEYPWPADTFVPNMLQYYDLPELAAAASCPVRLFGLRNGSGAPASEEECAVYKGANTDVCIGVEQEEIIACIHSLI